MAVAIDGLTSDTSGSLLLVDLVVQINEAMNNNNDVSTNDMI